MKSIVIGLVVVIVLLGGLQVAKSQNEETLGDQHYKRGMGFFDEEEYDMAEQQFSAALYEYRRYWKSLGGGGYMEHIDDEMSDEEFDDLMWRRGEIARISLKIDKAEGMIFLCNEIMKNDEK